MTTFNVGVKAIIIQNDLVLLAKRVTKDGYFWEAPGGRIDDNETLEDTLTRELNEELPGIAGIKIGNLLHAYRIPGMPLGDKGLVLLWFAVSASFPSGVKISDEHDEYKWCTFSEVEDIAAPGVAQAIKNRIQT